MAGKILTEDDFKGGDTPKEDTPKEEFVSADQKFDQDGNKIEGPKGDDAPKKKEDGEEPLPKPSNEKKYKYASMDEVERAYAEAERKMHEATTRASSYEKELAQYKKPPEKSEPTEDEKVAEIMDEANKQISALPIEYDSEGRETQQSYSKRNREYMLIMGKANRKISRLEIDAENKAKEQSQTTSKKLYNKAKDEGFNMDDEDDLSEIAFQWERSSGDTIDDRISNAVTNAKSRLDRLRGKVKEKVIEDIERDKKEKDNLKVLGRGSSRKDDKQEMETKPVTMSQQLTELHEKRRITKDDFR